MTDIQLKHCPFCGWGAKLSSSYKWKRTPGIKRNRVVVWMAHCKKCYAKTVKKEDMGTAIFSWNRRI